MARRRDALIHCVLHLLEGAHLDLAHALARDGEFLGQLHERDLFLGEPLKKWISLDQSRDMCAAPPVREGATPGVSGPVTLEVVEFQRGSVLAPVRPAVDCLPDFPAAAPTADRA